MSNNTKKAFMCASLLLLAGCASYNACSLSTLSPEMSIQSDQNSGVLVSWKVFNKDDCHIYLGRDVLAEGYVPVQVTIRNNSNDPMYLSAGSFNIPLTPAQNVAKRVHTSTATRVAAWGVGGLVFWPLIIPAVYDGIGSSEANQLLDTDYQSKTLADHTIHPHALFNGVVFVPKEKINQPIEMFLVNEKTHEKIIFPMVR